MTMTDNTPTPALMPRTRPDAAKASRPEYRVVVVGDVSRSAACFVTTPGAAAVRVRWVADPQQGTPGTKCDVHGYSRPGAKYVCVHVDLAELAIAEERERQEAQAH